MNAFITGSRVYGNTTIESDVDLVVLVATATDRSMLVDLGHIPVRYGKLNLIVLTDQREFDAWLAATYRCLSCRPCSREKAAEIIDQEYVSRGLPPRTGDSTDTNRTLPNYLG